MFVPAKAGTHKFVYDTAKMSTVSRVSASSADTHSQDFSVCGRSAKVRCLLNHSGGKLY